MPWNFSGYRRPGYHDAVTRRAWLGVGSIATAVAIAMLLLRGTTSDAPAVAATGWPSPSFQLHPKAPVFPDGFGMRRVYVDAGHGAEGNTGNLSAFCEDEQDFTLRAAIRLASRLESTGRFEARVSRKDGAASYPERVRAAQEWGADAFVSVHSDVRGNAGVWSPRKGQTCPMADSGVGFAVLYSDEGSPELVEGRGRLARHVAVELASAGFVAYGGNEYGQVYAAAQDRDGVFVDRHAMDKRIFVLRRTSMPAVILETHNALHAVEALRWTEDETLEAMSAAIASALASALAEARGLSAQR